ncbi:hypothetical protein MTBUT4_480025 [Magnetospirillum sp. UT-4]|nr:hypothetical protein MTBUT4_480025 [Magnetospirillum sp. UT-4]
MRPRIRDGASLPLDRPRRLGSNVVGHPVDALDLVDDGRFCVEKGEKQCFCPPEGSKRDREIQHSHTKIGEQGSGRRLEFRHNTLTVTLIRFLGGQWDVPNETSCWNTAHFREGVVYHRPRILIYTHECIPL